MVASSKFDETSENIGQSLFGFFTFDVAHHCYGPKVNEGYILNFIVMLAVHRQFLGVYIFVNVPMQFEVSCLKVVWTWIKFTVTQKYSNQLSVDRFHFWIALIFDEFGKCIPDFGDFFDIELKNLFF